MSISKVFTCSLLGLAFGAMAGCSAADDNELDFVESESVDESVSALGPADPIYVGVLADVGQNGKRPCADAPKVSDAAEELRIHLDNENDNDDAVDNHTKPWVGASTTGANTTLVFCRVRGEGFKRPVGVGKNYAVLKLSDTCPSGSKDLTWYFDAENDNGRVFDKAFCATPYFEHWEGDKMGFSFSAGPNKAEGCNNLRLRFCVFEAASNGASDPFPEFGSLRYGVFEGGGRAGYLYSNDQDRNNKSSISSDADYSTIMRVEKQPDTGTHLFMHRVQPYMTIQDGTECKNGEEKRVSCPAGQTGNITRICAHGVWKTMEITCSKPSKPGIPNQDNK